MSPDVADTIVTATELKANVCDILNRVAYTKTTIAVERHGKIVAHIIPAPKLLKKLKNTKTK
jgi:prevent-host-death family protein